MALRPSNRLSAPTLSADRATLAAISELDNYQPLNPDYGVAELSNLELTLTQAEQAEARARRALEAARDQAVAAAHAFHAAILGAKSQVIAQYGADSLAVQAIGLKRRSERKRPIRRPAATPMQ